VTYEHVARKNNFVVDYLTQVNDIKDKGKAVMEDTNEEQLLKKFENIINDINEYCEAIDEKIKLIEEKVVDLRVDL